ncbi:hypothetical protein ACTFIW_006052 [Dictyostelium discoideum]
MNKTYCSAKPLSEWVSLTVINTYINNQSFKIDIHDTETYSASCGKVHITVRKQFRSGYQSSWYLYNAVKTFISKRYQHNGLTCQTRFQVKSGKEAFPLKQQVFFGEQESSFEKLYTRRKNKFHSKCLTLSNGDWDKSFLIPQDVKSEISHWLTVLNQWNGKEISLFPSYDYVLTTDASESGTCTTLKKGKKIIKT